MTMPLTQRSRPTALRCLLAVLSVALPACGTTGPAVREQTPETWATRVEEAFRSPLQLGHFTTADGGIGLILDRTSEPPRVKFDSSDDIFELTAEDDREGIFKGIYYLSAEGKKLIFAAKDGRLALWPTGDNRPLVRDGDAKPLPDATVRGRYQVAPSVWERSLTALEPVSVLRRYPTIKDDDASRLDIVGQVLVEAPDDMWFVVEHPESLTHTPLRSSAPALERLQPVDSRVGESLVWKADATGLASFGVVITAKPGIWGAGGLSAFRLMGYPTALQVGTPGVVWTTLGGTIVFVAADGSRHEVSNRPWDSSFELPLGRMPKEPTWPKEPQAVSLHPRAIAGLVKLGDLTEKDTAGLATATQTWEACGREVLDGVPSSEREEADGLNALRRRDSSPTRLAELDASWRERIGRKCFSMMSDYERAYLLLLEGRKKRAQALLARVRAAWAARHGPSR